MSPGTELIALSANDDLDDIRAMIRAGVGAYLVKGEGSAEIVDAVHRCVEGSDGRTRWARPPASVVRHTPVRQPRAAATDRSRRARSKGSRSSISRSSTSRTAGRSARRRSVGFSAHPAPHAGRLVRGGRRCWTRHRTRGSPAVRRAVQSLDWLRPIDRALGVNVSLETCCSPELPELLDVVPRSPARSGDHGERTRARLTSASLAGARPHSRTRRTTRDRRHVLGIREPSPRPPPPAEHDQARYHPHAWRRDGYRTPSAGLKRSWDSRRASEPKCSPRASRARTSSAP